MFNYTEEQKFLVNNISKMIENGLLDYKYGETYKSIDNTLRKIFEANLLNINIPKKYGGNELDLVSQLIILYLIAKEKPTIAHILGAHIYGYLQPIIDFATDDQKEHLLTEVIESFKIGTLSFTEPNGCNIMSMQHNAKIEKDNVLINGTKSMVTMGNKCDNLLLFTKTAKNGNDIKKNFSMILISPKDKENIVFGNEERLMGFDLLPIAEMSYLDYVAKSKDIIGGEGDGLKILRKQLITSRLANASIALGIAERAYEEAFKFSQNRVLKNKPLNENPLINQKIAEMKIQLETIKLLTFYTANNNGLDITLNEKLLNSSIAKIQTTEFGKKICDNALQIHGGYGYMKEYKIEQLYRDIRAYTILGGSSEVIIDSIGSQLIA